MKILQDLCKIFEDLAKDLVKILSRSYQDPVKILSRSFRILQDPSRSLARSLKILARSLKILEDPGGSLKILTRIFKDLDEDPHKDPHEDPQRSLKILERFSPGNTQRRRKTVLIQFPQRIDQENQSKYFSTGQLWYFFQISSQKSCHSTLAVNATVLT